MSNEKPKVPCKACSRALVFSAEALAEAEWGFLIETHEEGFKSHWYACQAHKTEGTSISARLTGTELENAILEKLPNFKGTVARPTVGEIACSLKGFRRPRSTVRNALMRLERRGCVTKRENERGEVLWALANELSSVSQTTPTQGEPSTRKH